MFLTETWLDPGNSAAVLIDKLPTNLNLISEAKMHKKGCFLFSIFRDID